MFAEYKKKLISGAVFGLGFALVVTSILIVRAVTPGAVSNPTFGPQDDDVTGTFFEYPIKICSAIEAGDFRDTIIAGHDWDVSDCIGFAADVGASGHQVGCMPRDAKINFSNPSTCGW